MASPLRFVLALVVLSMSFFYIRAENPEGKRPVGNWEKKMGENSIKWEIKKDELQITVSTGDATIVMDADYSIAKNGTLYALVKKVDKKGTCAGPSEGDLFSIKFSVEKDILNIKELRATQESEDAKQLVQGEYKKLGN